MNIFIDTECSGLPIFDEGNRWKFPSFTQLSNYDTARVVSICWLVCQHDKIVEQAYFIIKPDHFVISEESYKIHGISQDEAETHGIPIVTVLNQLRCAVEKCKGIVAHNIAFDFNVICSECFRYGLHDVLKAMQSANQICTMVKGREYMNTRKYPKLCELYDHLYHENMVNAHNALADTLYCHKCYIKMFPADKSVFFFRNKEVRLTQQQQDIVYEKMETPMLIVAGAGSGKTTTLLSRIKYLIDQGVSESSIILTTFTWDAANDMKAKLSDIMGYKTNIKVGTIDGISKVFLVNHEKKRDRSLKHVGEYGHEFLSLLRSKPELMQSYQYLFVDEFQDINQVQFDIISEFVRNNVVLCAVGDDAQNIYSFRGSNVQYMLDFNKHFPIAKAFMLTTNFRSTSSLVDFANACMKPQQSQIPKDMVCKDPKDIGSKPTIQYFQSPTLQAAHITKQIQTLLAQGVSEDEIAVLSPINQTLFAIEELLTKENIKNNLLEGKTDVRNNIKKYHITLCTIHKAKGLEWDHVFFINVSDSIIPRMKNDKNIQEDRRLFYVGITRPRKGLYMSYSGNPPYVSRFVSAIPRNFYTFENFKPEFVSGTSLFDQCTIEKTVDKLIELLDGEDFVALKANDVIPKIDARAVYLYDAADYGVLITKESIQPDFSNFLRTILGYVACRVNKDTSFCQSARRILARVCISPKEHEQYRQFVASPDARLLDMDQWQPQKNQVLQEVIAMIRRNARKNAMLPSKVPVFARDPFPEPFIANVNKSLKAIATSWPDYETVLDELWTISKCDRVLHDQRKRLLFTTVDGRSIFKDNEPLIRNAVNGFAQLWQATATNGRAAKLAVNKEVIGMEDIVGNVDIAGEHVFLLLRMSNKEDIDISWVLQGLLLLAISQGTPNKLVIFNALRGKYYEIDVSNWTGATKLIAHVSQKRTRVLSRNAGISSSPA